MNYFLFASIFTSIMPPYKSIIIYRDKIVLEHYSFLGIEKRKVEFHVDRIKKFYTNENNKNIAMYFIYENDRSNKLGFVPIYKAGVPRLPEFLRALKAVVKEVDSESNISREEIII